MVCALAQNAILLPAKVFVCNPVKTFVIYLEGGLENPRKRMETREKNVFLKLLFT